MGLFGSSGIFGRRKDPQDGTMPMDMSGMALSYAQPDVFTHASGGAMDLSSPTAHVDWNDVGKPQMTGKPGYDDVGGLHDKLNALAASLKMAGGNNEAGQSITNSVTERAKMADQSMRVIDVERLKLTKPLMPTSLMQNALPAGLVPGTKAYADFITNGLMKPTL